MAKLTRRTVSAKVQAATAHPAPNNRVASVAKAAAVPTGWLIWGNTLYLTRPGPTAVAAIPAITVLGRSFYTVLANADKARAAWAQRGATGAFVTADPTGVQAFTSGPSGSPVYHPPTVPARIDSPPVEVPEGRWFVWSSYGYSYVSEVAAINLPGGAPGMVPWGNVATFQLRGDAEAFAARFPAVTIVTQDWSGTRDKPPVAG